MKKKNPILIGGIIICFLLFLLISQLLFTDKIIAIDTSVYNWLNYYLINDVLTNIMKGITWGSHPIFLIILLFALALLVKDKKKVIVIYVNLFGIVFLNQTFKLILKRLRPLSINLITETGYSFPSGHAMVSLSLYGFLTYLFLQQQKKKSTKIMTLIISSCLIFLISFSRIYLGVHYFSDVLAGLLFSTFYLYLFIKAYNNFKWKKNWIKLMNSFKYAFEGIRSSFKSERNMKIHVTVLSFVLLFGILLKISLLEWIACIFCFALVIGGELFNTALETTVNLITEEKNEKAKKAKDIAAGAVLVFALASSIIGILIFLPKFIALLK